MTDPDTDNNRAAKHKDDRQTLATSANSPTFESFDEFIKKLKHIENEIKSFINEDKSLEFNSKQDPRPSIR